MYNIAFIIFATDAKIIMTEKVTIKPWYTHHITVTNITFHADLQLDCIRPYVSWKLYPAEYIKKHISPASFISKECKVTKKFGHAINEVTIMTFDKNTKQQEMQNALQQANTRLQSLLQSTDMKTASLKNATQSFVNENQNEAAQMVSKFDDGTVESALSIIDNVLAANNPQSTRKTIQSIPQALGWKVVQQ